MVNPMYFVSLTISGILLTCFESVICTKRVTVSMYKETKEDGPI